MDKEVEEFVRLLTLHPELCPVLRQILEQQAQPPEVQEKPQKKA